jgi:hypothetical protein
MKRLPARFGKRRTRNEELQVLLETFFVRSSFDFIAGEKAREELDKRETRWGIGRLG